MQRRMGQSGMTLIEIMIAISVLSIISVIMMTLSKNMDKSVKTAEKNADMLEVMAEITKLMTTNNEACSATVLGAAASGTTRISSIKEIDTNGAVQAHNRLRVSTAASPVYVANGMIINGMFLKWLSNTNSGASYELHVTFLKSVKAAGTTAGATMVGDTFYGANIVTKKIQLQLDNCARYVAFGRTPAEAQAQCTAGNGSPTGQVVTMYSDAPASAEMWGITDYYSAVACRICTSRPRVHGCI